MQINKRILKISIIIIITTLVLSLGTKFYLHLDEPVFLKSYRQIKLPTNEAGYFEDIEFEIRYITNANDSRTVNHIEFEEAPELNVSTSENRARGVFSFYQDNRMPGKVVGTYRIKSIYTWVDAHDVDTNDEIHLTKAKVHFTNGEIIEVDIGDIVLFGYNKNDEYFEFSDGGSSSDGTSSSRMKVKQNISLLKIESPILDEVKNFVEYKINNVDYDEIEGMKFTSGDYLNTNTIVTIPEDILQRFNTYEIHPMLYFEENDGNIFTYYFYDIDYNKYNFEFKLNEIVKYLRARGEL